MTLLVKRNRGLFPSLVSDFFDTNDFFSADLLDFNRNLSRWNDAANLPSVNINETEKSFNIELAAPGFNKNDFNIEVDDNGVLSISAEVKAEKKEEEKNYTRKEFSYNSFSRSFRLPENANADNVDAAFENGVLKLTLPKKETTPVKHARTIKIA